MSDEEAREEIEALRAELRRLERRIDTLEESLDSDDRPSDPPAPAEEKAPFEESSATEPEPARSDAPPEPEAPPESKTPPEPGTPAQTGPDDPADQGRTAGSAGEPTEDTGRIGDPVGISAPRLDADAAVTWLGRVGILALVVGVGLFVSYAIQEELIGYLGRVLLGVTAGLALFAVGTYALQSDRYERWGGIVASGGIAITYFSIYASYHFTSYREAIGTPLWLNLALLSLIVVSALGFAVAFDRRGVAGGAFLLGYVTAWLGSDFGVLTLAYVLLLTAGVTAVVRNRSWPELIATSLLGTYGIYLAWLVGVDDPLVPGVPVLVAAFGCHILAIGWRAAPGWGYPNLTRAIGAGLAVANALAFALAGELTRLLVVPGEPLVHAGFYAALTACYAGLYAAGSASVATTGKRHSPLEETLAAPYLAVLFALVAVVVGVGTLGITIGWALLALVLVGVALRFDLDPPRYASHAVAVLLVCKVAVIDALLLEGPTTAEPLSGTRPLAFLVAVGVCCLLAVMADRRSGPPSSAIRSILSVPTAYSWVTVALLVELLALELGGAATTAAWALLVLALVGLSFRVDRLQLRLAAHGLAVLLAGKVVLVDAVQLETATAGAPLADTRAVAFAAVVVTFALLYVWFDRQQPALSAPERNDWIPVELPYAWAATTFLVALLGLELSGVWISVAWALLGLALLLVGLGAGARELRLQGIALFVLTTGKVFLLDTAGLDAAGRTLSFLVLGAILVFASWVYARYRDELENVL